MRALLAVPLAAAAVSACVTINVYFPAAAAEKAADRVIDEVWGKGGVPPAATPPATAPAPVSSRPLHFTLDGVLMAVLDAIVPAAHAQADANLDISSPEIQALQAAMAARHADLLAFYASGAVGIAADGGLAVRDLNLVGLPLRAKAKKLVADENADRDALYREIARANGHPEWEAQIRSTFAKRWVARAQAGWYVQAGGAWAQK